MVHETNTAYAEKRGCMSKHQHRVLRGLRRKALTSAEIIERFGLIRPADVIAKLRAKGHHIVTLPRGPSRMAIYVLLSEA